MTTATYSKYVLDNTETLQLLTAFCFEALRFLNVSEMQYPQIRIGIASNPNGKMTPLFIDYARGKVLVYIPFFKMLITSNPNNNNDSPTVYRSLGYKIARVWQVHHNTGEQRDFITDADSFIFAKALMILKGLPIIDASSNPEVAKMKKEVMGFAPTNNQPAIDMLKNEFGIECRTRRAFDMANQRDLDFITFTAEEQNRRGKELMHLREECNNRPLPAITEGDLGSKTNPFDNVDKAATYILKIEQERLQTDNYRQTIDNEQYYYDFERGYFRIPWASANVGFYPLEKASYPCFVINQLEQTQKGKHALIPRFSIKPSLARNKFLFRGQSQYFSPCKPNLFRDKKKTEFVDDIIQVNELEVLLRQHPLVKLFEEGFMLLNELIRFKINYAGLSQHYYNRTPLLDLTSDMDVAKFFAVTTFDMDNDRYVKYDGNELGVLYYFDLAADAFNHRDGRKYHIDTIGKQPFMRSGSQSGFLIGLEREDDFNTFSEVRYVFFRHDAATTNRIFADSLGGNKYMPQELLRSHWYKRMSDKEAMKKISTEAVKLNFANNPDKSHSSIVKELHSKGFHISGKNKPEFTAEELDDYYANIEKFWDSFCSNIYFYSPEGALLKEHLINLPNDPRYSWAFHKS